MNRYERNKLKRIEKNLIKAEMEYIEKEKDYSSSEGLLENLSEIFSEMFGEKIVFVDITDKMEKYDRE